MKHLMIICSPKDWECLQEDPGGIHLNLLMQRVGKELKDNNVDLDSFGKVTITECEYVPDGEYYAYQSPEMGCEYVPDGEYYVYQPPEKVYIKEDPVCGSSST